MMNFGLSLTTLEVDNELTKLHVDLDSRDMNRVLRALDYMMKNTDGLISTCTDQYATLFEHREDILHSLERLLDVVNPLAADEFPCPENLVSSIDGMTFANSLLTHVEPCWSANLSNRPHEKLRHLAQTMDENYVLISILTILRNMCHEVPNEVFVASSYAVMNHCIHIIMTCTYNSNVLGDCFLLALELLNLVGKKIDLSGRRRMAWSATSQFLIGTGSTNRNAGLPLLYPRYKRHEQRLGATQAQYVRVVQNLLPWCSWAIRQVSNRVLTYKATELVSKLANSQDNQPSFVRAPREFYIALVDLVCTSVTAAEPLVAVDPANPDLVGRYRFPPARCGNFFSDASDEVLRDCALAALLELCSNNFGTGTHILIQDKLIEVPNVLHILMRIAMPIFPSAMDPRQGKVHVEGQSKAVHLLAALQFRAFNAHRNLFARVSAEMSMAVCTENPLQEAFGEKLFHIINRSCEGRFVDGGEFA